MKSNTKLLSLLLVLCLAVVGLVIGVAAEDEPVTDYTDPVNMISTDSSVDEYSYLVYPTKAAFEADIDENRVLDGDTAAKKVTKAEANGQIDLVAESASDIYIYLLEDLEYTYTAQSYMFGANDCTVDMGGNVLVVNSAERLNLYPTDDRTVTTDYAFYNGKIEVSNTGANPPFVVRQDSVLRFINVDINLVQNGSYTFIQAEGSIIFEDVNFVNNAVAGSMGSLISKRTSPNQSTTQDVGDKTVYRFHNFTAENPSGKWELDLVDLWVGKAFYEDISIELTGDTYLGDRLGPVLSSTSAANSANLNINIKIETSFRAYINPVTKLNNFVNAVANPTVKYVDEDGDEVVNPQFGRIATLDENGATKVGYGPATAVGYTVTSGGTATEYYGNYATAAELTGTDVTVQLFGDLYYEASAAMTLKGDSTVTLNGKTLYIHSAGVNNNKPLDVSAGDNVTFAGGAIHLLNQGTAYNVAGGTLTFDNVDLRAEVSYYTNGALYFLANISDGTVNVLNGSDFYIDYPNNYGVWFIETAEANKNIKFNCKDSTMETCVNKDWAYSGGSKSVSTSLIYVGWSAGLSNIDVDINFDNVSVNNTTKPFVIMAGLNSTSNIDINVKGSYMTSINPIQLRAAHNPLVDGEESNLVNYNVSNTYYSNWNMEPQFSADLLNLNYGSAEEKEALMYIERKTGYSYVVAKPTNTSLYTNLSLYSDFNLNFYVPTENNIWNISGAEKLIDEATGNQAIVNVNGTPCYAYVVKDIAPTSAQDKIELGIRFEAEHGEIRTLLVTYSVIDYAQDYFAGATTDAGTALIKSTVAYVKAATLAANPEADVSALNTLLGDYSYTPVIPENTVTLPANDYVESATFVVEENVTLLRLKLHKDAVITVSGTETYVKDGYVYAELRAFMLVDSFYIYADGNYVGTYSLAAYYNSNELQGASDAAKALVKALYAYAESANAYKLANA